MQSIGSFGSTRAPVNLGFWWCGQDPENWIRVHPNATDIDFIAFMSMASEVQVDLTDEDRQDPARMAAALEKATGAVDTMYKFLSGQIHPDDWDRFLRIAKENRQRVQDIMILARQITEAVSRFPTGQPSDSRGIGSTTTSISPDGSRAAERTARRKQERKEAKRRRKAEREAMVVDTPYPGLTLAPPTATTANTGMVLDAVPPAPTPPPSRRLAIARAAMAQVPNRPDIKVLIKRQYEAAEAADRESRTG